MTDPSTAHATVLNASRRRRPHGRGTGAVTAYDFRRPVNLSRELARVLQITFEGYARQASTALTTVLRSVCQVELDSVAQVAYSEYVDSLGDMTYMTVFAAEPLQQLAVLETPLAMTMSCLDRLLGGSGAGPHPVRPITELERTVVGGLYERLVAEVRTAFVALVPLETRIKAVEYNPQLAQVATFSDIMVVARFTLRMEEQDYPLSLCMSFPGLLPFLSAAGEAEVMSERERLLREQASTRLAAGLQEIPIEVAVRFRATNADPLELADLRPGDVVRLSHPAQAPLDVTAADVVFAHATPGTQGTRLAALVVAPAHQEKS